MISRDVTEEVTPPKSNLITSSKNVETNYETLVKMIDGLRSQKTPNLLENESNDKDDNIDKLMEIVLNKYL